MTRTELKVRKHVDHILAKFGLTTPQYTVLSVLEESNRATNADIARLCSVTPQTMSRIVQVMERDGFLKKDLQKIDGLKVYYELTKKAEKAVCAAHIEINDIETKMTQGMSKTEIDRFQKFMNLCCDNLKSEN